MKTALIDTIRYRRLLHKTGFGCGRMWSIGTCSALARNEKRLVSLETRLVSFETSLAVVTYFWAVHVHVVQNKLKDTAKRGVSSKYFNQRSLKITKWQISLPFHIQCTSTCEIPTYPFIYLKPKEGTQFGQSLPTPLPPLPPPPPPPHRTVSIADLLWSCHGTV